MKETAYCEKCGLLHNPNDGECSGCKLVVRVKILEQQNKNLRECKVHYDRVFSKAIAIPIDEYSDLIADIAELEQQNKELIEALEEIGNGHLQEKVSEMIANEALKKIKGGY